AAVNIAEITASLSLTPHALSSKLFPHLQAIALNTAVLVCGDFAVAASTAAEYPNVVGVLGPGGQIVDLFSDENVVGGIGGGTAGASSGDTVCGDGRNRLVKAGSVLGRVDYMLAGVKMRVPTVSVGTGGSAVVGSAEVQFLELEMVEGRVVNSERGEELAIFLADKSLRMRELYILGDDEAARRLRVCGVAEDSDDNGAGGQQRQQRTAATAVFAATHAATAACLRLSLRHVYALLGVLSSDSPVDSLGPHTDAPTQPPSIIKTVTRQTILRNLTPNKNNNNNNTTTTVTPIPRNEPADLLLAAAIHSAYSQYWRGGNSTATTTTTTTRTTVAMASLVKYTRAVNHVASLIDQRRREKDRIDELVLRGLVVMGGLRQRSRSSSISSNSSSSMDVFVIPVHLRCDEGEVEEEGNCIYDAYGGVAYFTPVRRVLFGESG
ncbi:hypothetical protein HK100_010140, partial [Physocladia obscura]